MKGVILVVMLLLLSGCVTVEQLDVKLCLSSEEE